MHRPENNTYSSPMVRHVATFVATAVTTQLATMVAMVATAMNHSVQCGVEMIGFGLFMYINAIIFSKLDNEERPVHSGR